jgi:hypothetical protein
MADEEKKEKSAKDQVEDARKAEEAENEDAHKQKLEARDYLKKMGLSSRIERNDFGVEDAFKVFAKAKDALETRETNRKIVTGILDKAYQLLRLLT